MRAWYLPADTLGLAGDHVLPESTGLAEAVALIASTAGLPLDDRRDDFLPLDRSASAADGSGVPGH